MDRASDSGSECWGFESLRACQLCWPKRYTAKTPHESAVFLLCTLFECTQFSLTVPAYRCDFVLPEALLSWHWVWQFWRRSWQDRWTAHQKSHLPARQWSGSDQVCWGRCTVQRLWRYRRWSWGRWPRWQGSFQTRHSMFAWWQRILWSMPRTGLSPELA